jgi:hypothetical protein
LNEIKSPIKLIGISVNGGWKKKPKDFGLDGSVNIESCDFTGEVSKSFSDLETALIWLKDSYPDWLNYTCGLRVALQVESKELLNQIMNKKFYEVFRKNAKEWGLENKITKGSQFWQRYDGNNKYCEKGFSSKTKYKQLNFTLKDKNVVECRIFPTFQKIKLSESAVGFFYNLVNNYLGLRSLVN